MITDAVAEQHVIGAVLLSGGAALNDLDLTEDDFGTYEYQRLWKAIHAYRQGGKPLSPELLLGYITQHGQAQALGEWLMNSVSGVIPQQAPYFAAQLKVATLRRNIAALSDALAQVSGNPGDFEPDELMEQAQSQVDRFLTVDERSGRTELLRDNALRALEERWGKPDTNFLPTGWGSLDDKLNGGLRPGHLTVVGARPSVGKSFVATGIAKFVASRGEPVLFHSLEMSADELTDRVMASVGQVNLSTLNSGHADAHDLDKLGDRIGDILEWPLHIDDRSNITLAGISGRARDMARRDRLSLIVVDYLQLISPADRRANREQQVAALSRGLKLLAKELRVPIVALAQLNRGTVDRKPTMADLRESGSIEADADEVLLLHRSDEDRESGLIEVIIDKNRHGSTGSVQMAFFPSFGDLADL